MQQYVKGQVRVEERMLRRLDMVYLENFRTKPKVNYLYSHQIHRRFGTELLSYFREAHPMKMIFYLMRRPQAIKYPTNHLSRQWLASPSIILLHCR